MASQAQSSAFDPRVAADTLRSNQRLAGQASSNVAQNRPDEEDENLPASVERAESGLRQDEQFAAGLRRERMARATTPISEAMLLPQETGYGGTSEEYLNESEELENEAEQLRVESMNESVDQLGPTRGRLAQLEQRAIGGASKEIKKTIEEAIKRAGTQLKINGLNAVDIPHEDTGITFWLTTAYNYVRFAYTIFGDAVIGPEPKEMKGASDVASYAMHKAINEALPKYKLFSGTPIDTAEAAYGMASFFAGTAVLVALVVTLVVIIIILASAAKYMPGLGTIIQIVNIFS